MSIMLDSTLKRSDLYLLHEIVHDAPIGRIPNKQNLQKREKGLKLHQFVPGQVPPPPHFRALGGGVDPRYSKV